MNDESLARVPGFVRFSGGPVRWDHALRGAITIGGPTLFCVAIAQPTYGLIASVCGLWIWLNDMGGRVVDRAWNMAATGCTVLLGGIFGATAGSQPLLQVLGILICAFGIGWVHDTSRAVENAARSAGFAFVVVASLGLRDPALLLAALGGISWALCVAACDQLITRRISPETGTSLRAGLARLKLDHVPDWRFGIRYAIAASTGLGLAQIFGATHAAWATITTLAVMRPNQAESMRLIAQRAGGTLAGVVIASGVVSVSHNPFVLAFAVACFAFTISPLQTWQRWGGFAAITATILVLLDVALLSEGGSRPLFLERILDTGIGCIVALAATWLIFPRRAQVARV